MFVSDFDSGSLQEMRIGVVILSVGECVFTLPGYYHSASWLCTKPIAQSQTGEKTGLYYFCLRLFHCILQLCSGEP